MLLLVICVEGILKIPCLALLFLCFGFLETCKRYGSTPSCPNSANCQLFSESICMLCDDVFNFWYFSNVNLQQNRDGKGSNLISKADSKSLVQFSAILNFRSNAGHDLQVRDMMEKKTRNILCYFPQVAQKKCLSVFESEQPSLQIIYFIHNLKILNWFQICW